MNDQFALSLGRRHVFQGKLSEFHEKSNERCIWIKLDRRYSDVFQEILSKFHGRSNYWSICIKLSSKTSIP